ncbi:MAG: DNA-binding transcriptional regulator Lrp family [Candidatus Methanohalarchaeum thermophilum]|uniref:siroheme decarboxylase n=1 Tax=Methanohalarchaeum thermophilum TaxID=1903181 RepID=A0A1Q6DS52_METT1|nr:MAG: DNA-binding transcriptional regulator Lrp family [Candidatus Methanohalarchaeum thermophilum]
MKLAYVIQHEVNFFGFNSNFLKIMDEIDRKILDKIQSHFPLKRRPFKELASDLGVEEEEVLSRVQELSEKGYIRRISPILDSRELGFKGTLVAMKVPEQRLNSVVEVINGYREVSHNYKRDHEYNLWFTITAIDENRIDEIISEIKDRTDVEKAINLPSEKMYKIGVSFSIED